SRSRRQGSLRWWVANHPSSLRASQPRRADGIGGGEACSAEGWGAVSGGGEAPGPAGRAPPVLSDIRGFLLRRPASGGRFVPRRSLRQTANRPRPQRGRFMYFSRMALAAVEVLAAAGGFFSFSLSFCSFPSPAPGGTTMSITV